MSDARPLIAHIVFRFDYGGLENGMVNLVNGSENGRFRHVIIALTEATEFSRRLRDGVPVHALGKRPGKDPLAYWRLFRLLRALKPTVVHTRNWGTLDCAFVAYLAGVPVRIHGEHGWDVFDPDGTRRKYRVARQILSRFIHAFVTVSDELQRWLISVIGLPSDKVMRICNGVDTERFRPAHRGELASLPTDMLGPDTLVVGSVTRFSAIKDPLNLVEAFILLRARGGTAARDVRLLMVGDGELREQALRRLEQAGLATAAWLPGSRNDIPNVLRCMDIFVLTSLREGISNTILEAMASGLPVIASNTGGNPELIVADETGALVPPADVESLATILAAYLRDTGLRERQGRQARQRAVTSFSIAAMLANYQRLYDHTIAVMEA